MKSVFTMKKEILKEIPQELMNEIKVEDMKIHYQVWRGEILEIYLNDLIADKFQLEQEDQEHFLSKYSN